MLLYVCAFLAVTMVAGSQFNDNERYTILLEKGSDAGDIEELIQSMEVHASSTREEMHVRSLTSLLPFVFGNMSEATAEMVSKLPNVELIEKDQVVNMFEDIYRDYSPVMDSSGFHRYNLDILDNVDCTDNYFTPFNYGLGADIYVIDSGINYDHVDFRWRNGTSGTRAKLGFDAIDDLYSTNQQGRDRDGTGTHFAGISGGVDSGVAKDANLYSVRIRGQAPYYGTWAVVISGLEAVSRLHDINSVRSDFVGSIASIITAGQSRAADKAARALWDKGIVTVVPSGNTRSDSCAESFCRATYICVGAHRYDECSCKKKMWRDSGFGRCLDFLAPGETILSASHESDDSYTFESGTYVASSHVAGIAALMKAANPALSQLDIVNRLLDDTVDDIDRSHMPYWVISSSHSGRVHVSSELIA